MTQLAALGLPYPMFLSWKQALECRLSEDPQECLEFIPSGKDSFHESRLEEVVGPRRFQVIWEIEWDRSVDRFHVLEVTIDEIKSPNLHGDPNSRREHRG